MGTSTQPIRFINQQINPFTSLKHTLNILCHNVPYTIDLSTSCGKRVRRRRSIIGLQQRAQFSVESSTAIGWERGEVRAGWWICGEELALHFKEISEWDAAALLGGGDDDIAERRVRIWFCAVVLLVIRTACW